MHDTVAKIHKQIQQGDLVSDFARLFSQRLQEEGGVARALAEPLADHVQILYREGFRWVAMAEQLASLAEGEAAEPLLGELLFAARQIRTVVADVVPFLERVEDTLSERDEVTHRESGYEREVAPFSRLDSTRRFRDFLGGRDEFSGTAVSEGAQAEADLLKIVYMGNRIEAGVPKPGDLYALVMELLLDCRRHLQTAFDEDSAFLAALRKAVGE